MILTVYGFQSGTLDTARLGLQALKRKAALLPVPLSECLMHGYGVEADGVDFLEQRYSREFENFLLLDDVAIEACEAPGIPHGERLGVIGLGDMGDRASKLFSLAYWTGLDSGPTQPRGG
jgi:hypothetical protein